MFKIPEVDSDGIVALLSPSSLLKEPKLPKYKYTQLKSSDSLRLVRLRPARENQEDIDCEIIEVAVDDYIKSDKSGNVSRFEMNADAEPDVVDVRDDDSYSEDINSSEEEEEENLENPAIEKEKHAKPLEGVPAEIHNKFQAYEAVSWFWGREPEDQILRVHKDDHVSALRISRNLKKALWALRKSNKVRYLWIDAICINQKDTQERNEQVPRMDTIYGMANNVCIWLGDADKDSHLAMGFIKKVLELWDFDKLIENKAMAKHWAALINLMKRPWFSRRWVVQEIALSPRGGTIYCGKEYASWQDFADAVSLFVEVESATHRLSEVMILDKDFGNIPDFFGDVPSLGAALLVDATSNLFRNSMAGERKPLSSLEYLVSRLSVFEATQPRDTIYALLAISKDTDPRKIGAGLDYAVLPEPEKHALKLAPPGGFVKQSYNVDYELPVIDVYQEFIEFSMNKSDKIRALDIICRPWAPRVLKSHDDPRFLRVTRIAKRKKKMIKNDQEIPLPSWIPGLSGAAFQMAEHPTLGLRMERQNADPLVGLPDQSGHRNYSAAGDTKQKRKVKFRKWISIPGPNQKYPHYSMFVSGFILDEVLTVEHLAQNGNIPYQWLWAGGWTDTERYPPEDFWRTLVADRGHAGRNPPTYFPRACKESMKFKAKTMSRTGGNLDTKKLINEGRCTIVAEFLRRTQEVIWNRQLMKTKRGRLGLARDDVSPGFKICILYGCSVPVILQEIQENPPEFKAEQEKRFNDWYTGVGMLVQKLQGIYRKRRYGSKEQPKEGGIGDQGVGSPKSAGIPENGNASQPSGPDLQHSDPPNGKPDGDASLPPETDPQDNAPLNGTPNDGDTNSNYINHPKPKRAEKAKTFRYEPEEEKENDRIRGKEEFEARVAMEKARPILPYRFLGECYVHGMMNGEAIALQNKLGKEMPEVVFELR